MINRNIININRNIKYNIYRVKIKTYSLGDELYVK
ncbi:Uncharacterised protein [Clostridium fallax]|uniref:Uncharacterized protein n=1 Tax=Clostridium fallax TaxID=1533 RepID=A0A1M4TA43_9CLOT|nr:hypothetical protein SAMN05443638_10291 [Clostridium fallax]SQB22669.1 Uncharacterised protein [Clostridium fallax]